MLRESSTAFGYPLDVAALVDVSVDPGVPHGRIILDFIMAVINDGALEEHHDRMIASVGPTGLVDAAAVLGNFEMMNRVAEGTGIPYPAAAIERERDIIETLGLDSMLKP